MTLADVDIDVSVTVEGRETVSLAEVGSIEESVPLDDSVAVLEDVDDNETTLLQAV